MQGESSFSLFVVKIYMLLVILRIQNKIGLNSLINEKILSCKTKKIVSPLSLILPIDYELKLHLSLEMDPGDMDEQQMKVRPMWKRFNKVTINLSFYLINIHKEVLGPSGPRFLAGGPSGLLTSSFAPFGRSGRVTHAKGT